MKKIRNVLLVFCSVFLMIVIAPLIGFYTNRIIILDRSQDPIVIPDSNDNVIQEAFAYPLTLQDYQKADIQFSMSLPNSTATLKILDKDIYETNYLLNSSPIDINGEDFLDVQEGYRHGGYSPSNYTTIYEEGSRHIRFSGGIYGSQLVYRPGNYVILVYGSHEEQSDDSLLFFNLLVMLDGPGNFIEILLITTGLIVLICYGLFITINFIRKIELPYKRRVKKKKILIIQK
jgi:hypothetical protein